MPAVWLTAAAVVVGGGIPALLLVRRAAREASGATEAMTHLAAEIRGALPAVGHGITHLQTRVDTMVRNLPRWRAGAESRHPGRPR